MELPGTWIGGLWSGWLQTKNQSELKGSTLMIQDILYRTIVNTMKDLGGFSVIPLQGKKPHPQITTWQEWQRGQPSIEQIVEWFCAGDVQAYGIITGEVSNGLIVIDFDKIRSYRKFRRDLPTIAQTYTVRTRRGKHVYLRPYTTIKSRKFKGGDIQGEGHYVVGQGSTIGQYIYQVEDAREIRELDENETQQLQRWLTEASPQMRQEGEALKVVYQAQNIEDIYRATAPQIGRNNALYKTAQIARQTGINKTEVNQRLVQLHITTEAYREHDTETHRTREKEALATIGSAYSGTVALKPKTYKVTETKGLIPNSIREAMLKSYQSTIPGRLLEACRREGWQGGQTFTIKNIQEIARKYKIGEHQVREAVTGRYSKTPNGTNIYTSDDLIRIVKYYPHVGDTDNRTKKCDSTSTERDKFPNPEQHVPNHVSSSGGRPPQQFIFPDIDYLCYSFGVVPLASDCLQAKDLLSSKQYLMALHRELILRLAPEYSTEWHAKRLNVSERTIRRYNQELGVIVTPVFEYRHLNWDNVDDSDLWKSSIRINVNGQDITPGQWIQRSDGKRFPAIKGVALDWMGRSQDEFVMCYRRPSRLQLAHANHPIIIQDVIWRCLDKANQPEWGGGEHDFPPIYKPTLVSPSNKIIPINKPIASSIPADEANIASILGLNVKPDSLGLLDNIPPEGIQARQQLGLLTYEKINLSLSLVSGLGTSRVEQLNDRGIFTLEQLILLGSERLYTMISWRGREYLSPSSCEKWVEEAQYLLNWKKRDPKVVAEEKRQQEQQEAVRNYKKNVQRFIDYLIAVREWEDEIFGTGQVEEISWNTLLDWFKIVMQRTETDPVYLTDPRTVDTVHTKVREFCTSYQKRIGLFSKKENWQLDEYMFGSMKKWKSLKRATARQFARFEHNDVWIGWN